jgi:putative flippase GtrA
MTGSIIIANVVATSAALIGSYLLHSKFTFKARKWKISTFILFASVTIFGLWVLQTYAIYLLTPIVALVPETLWRLLGPVETVAKILAPKILASGVTLVWNFVWYNKVIFRHKNPVEDVFAALD